MIGYAELTQLKITVQVDTESFLVYNVGKKKYGGRYDL